MAVHWPSPQVFLAWNLRVKRVEAVKDAYRVTTPQGQFCLKRTDLPAERLEAIAEALDHAARRGFHQATPFLPTRGGSPVYQDEQGFCYYLTEWLPGERPDLRQEEMFVPAAECLAAFHKAGEGFFDRGRLRDHLGQWPARLDQRARELRALQADQLTELRPDQFTQLYLPLAGRWVALAQWSLELVDQADYPGQVEAVRAVGGFCHGDPAERNFIWLGGQPFLIDFDTMLIDLPLLELARLIRRVEKYCGWDVDLAARMIDAYGARRPLGERERTLLVAALAFPQKYWRVVHRYYRDREGKSERHLRRRLEQVERSWAPLVAFLPRLAARLGVELPRPVPAA